MIAEPALAVRTVWRAVFPTQHAAWVFVNLSVRLATRVVVMALLARALTGENLAAWYVFNAIFGMAALAEGGLAKVMTRHVAYRAGTREGGNHRGELVAFIAATAKIYAVLVTIVCLLAGLFGPIWFSSAMNAIPEQSIYFAWGIFVAGSALALAAGFFGAVVSGLQEVATLQKNESVTSVVNLLTALLLLALVNNLMAPAGALLASSAVAFWLNQRVVQKNLPEFSFFGTEPGEIPSLARTREVWPEMGKMVVMMVAYHALTSGFVLLLSATAAAETVASYGLTTQMAGVVLTFANIWVTAAYPRLAALSGHGPTELRRTALPAMARGALLLVLGMAAIYGLGAPLLEFIGSRTALLGGSILIIVLTVIGSESLFSLVAQVPISQGRLDIAYYSLAGALFVLGTAVWLSSRGVDLAVVFLARLILYTAVVGIPSIMVCVRFLAYPRGTKP